MHIENSLDLCNLHVGKRLVTENPGVVDDDIDSVESVDSRLDYGGAALCCGDRVIVGNGLTTR